MCVCVWVMHNNVMQIVRGVRNTNVNCVFVFACCQLARRKRAMQQTCHLQLAHTVDPARPEIRVYSVRFSIRVCIFRPAGRNRAKGKSCHLHLAHTLVADPRYVCNMRVIFNSCPRFFLARPDAAEQGKKRVISSSRAMWIQTRDTSVNC